MARLCTPNKPLTATLCVLLSLLISLCSASNKGSNKPSDNKLGFQNLLSYKKSPAGLARSQRPPGPTGPPGNKSDAGNQGPQGPQDPQGLPRLLRRNWKKCTYKALNNRKDTGLIKRECVFNKTSDNTALRVLWNGVLQIYNCHGCCRRWYFTFNGTECSTPGVIDGVVHGDIAEENLYRVMHIEAYCEELHKGIVHVGFWVGNCAGYRPTDAFTGWKSVSQMYMEEIPPPQS